MIGYDFDDTIYKGNSYRHFYFYCLLRFPYLLIYVPVQLIFSLLYVVGIISKDAMMRSFCSFIIFVPHKEKRVIDFWNRHMKKFKNWYLIRHNPSDLVVSASPRYLVEEGCRRVGISKVIATEMNLKNGKIYGVHCYGEEKVTRYMQEYGGEPLEEFYSDSHSDSPMFRFASKGYYVKGETAELIFSEGEKVEESK